ncbi:MAG TPA: baseplate J/gp47 family protein [Acidobacteriaceae bacterium]|nr:baseplate J/gp47 family protein [Acidobacteriaceae bacterium]
MIYQCCDSSRRAVLLAQNVYNGIDYLEVGDGPLGCQTVLSLYFLHPLTPGQLQVDNILICGGERITNIQVASVVEGWSLSPPPVDTECSAGSPPNGSNLLVITVTRAGDFSTYKLRVVASTSAPAGSMQPPPYFDPVYSEISFSFKVGCPAWFDCQQSTACPAPVVSPPNFSYLAKDFSSFRSLILDRMSTILPAWTERHTADLGIVLVELLAFVGDYLSYQQDVVATEAYLATARRRTSVRRHVKLVDYPMLDGRNARAWIHFEVASDFVLNQKTPTGLPQQILTQGSFPGPIIPVPSDTYSQALSENPQVFEMMEKVPLFVAHNQMLLYTWGDQQCCLPAGATHAWLNGAYPNLTPGMVLIFQEAKGPQTGAPEDADATHRWAVRLTSVTAGEDPIGNLFLSPPSTAPLPVTRIAWSSADALPFAVCVSSEVGGDTPAYYDNVTVVLGNNGLADSGRTISGEMLPMVPALNPALVMTTSGGCERCSTAQAAANPPIRYNPQLASGPLSFADSYSATDSSGNPIPATNAINSRVVVGLLPSITLQTQDSSDLWTAVLDLLESQSDSKDFVAETEDDGTTSLRFGDGTFGMQVIPGDIFTAQYRVGGGTVSNVGMNSLSRIASDDSVLTGNLVSITNPLAASGGLDPETLDSVRANAPYAFNVQQRAVTAADYGTMAVEVDPALEQAVGTFRWTGSWYTVFISVDPEGTQTISDTTKATIVAGMENYRMAGHDVDVNAPVYVSLELTINVCAEPGYLAPDIQQALLQLLGTGTLPNGSNALFNPDNFTFGQPVYLSPIIATVQQTDGVASVTVATFQRQGQPATSGLTSGVIPLQSLEIARLDNDPNYPEHGILTVNVCGGN